LRETLEQQELESWEEIGEVLDAEESSVDDVREALERTQKGYVKSSIENCMTILNRDPWSYVKN